MNLSVFGKVNNILNTPLVVRVMQPNPLTKGGAYFLPGQDDPNSIVVEKEYYGQFKSVLPIKKIALLMKVEKDFQAEVLKQAINRAEE